MNAMTPLIAISAIMDIFQKVKHVVHAFLIAISVLMANLAKLVNRVITWRMMFALPALNLAKFAVLKKYAVNAQMDIIQMIRHVKIVKSHACFALMKVNAYHA